VKAASLPRLLLFPLLFALASLLWPRPARAADGPARVDVGCYVNSLQELSFKDSKYVIDFYVWFRWQGEGRLQDYKPLDSFEIVNGKIDSKSSVVEKKIGDVQYASARVSATMNEPWQLGAFPFDQHRISIRIEDSARAVHELFFAEDRANSRLGDDVRLAGWIPKNFSSSVAEHTYKSNYGDISLPRNAESTFSRFSFSLDLEREGHGVAVKILSIVLLSTLVSFVAFLVKPTDLDPRFGLGVGSLFAVAASEFIVASMVPDSGVMTLADQVHLLSMGVIFLSLLQSAGSLRLAVSGREDASARLDLRCAVAFPVLFVAALAWLTLRAVRPLFLRLFHGLFPCPQAP